MKLDDFARFSFFTVRAYPLRTFLAALGIAVGITAVILLTSIGEGLHGYVVSEFTQFGTNLIGVSPGHLQTAGMNAGIFGTVRPLTIADALALRRLPNIEAADPIVAGNGEIGWAGRRRRTTIYGVTAQFPRTLQMYPQIGTFLPEEDPYSARPFVVLGSRVRKELFGDENPLGRKLDIAGFRYIIVGVMASKGQVFGFDMDDTVYIPVQSALGLFNRTGVMEIHVTYTPSVPADRVVEQLRSALILRHGREDFTINSQQRSLEVLGSILEVLTFAVAGLGAISVLVGAIGILTIMTIAVSERIAEIGLLNAIGAYPHQILWLFLTESVLIAVCGCLTGILGGITLAYLLGLSVSTLPVRIPWFYVAVAGGSSLIIGLLSGIAPALQAARMQPIEALRSE